MSKEKCALRKSENKVTFYTNLIVPCSSPQIRKKYSYFLNPVAACKRNKQRKSFKK